MKHLILICIVCLSFLGCDSQSVLKQKCKKMMDDFSSEYDSTSNQMIEIASDQNNYEEGQFTLDAQNSLKQLRESIRKQENDLAIRLDENKCLDALALDTIADYGSEFASNLDTSFKANAKIKKLDSIICENMIKAGAKASDLLSANSLCASLVECADKLKSGKGLASSSWYDKTQKRIKGCKTFKLK